jgi:hypothetical protein
MGIAGALKGNRCPHNHAGELRVFLNILIGGGNLGVEFPINVGFADAGVGGLLIAVGLEEMAIACLLGKPIQLDKKPGVLQNQVIFQKLGVENGVTSIPSHSEPCVRLSPHTAPSLLSLVMGAAWAR